MDLVDNVRRWLDGHGFPMEMEVARLFFRDGAFVSQGGYFIDPETGTARETDVEASYTMQGSIDEIHAEVTVSAAVECKFSSLPWVAFGEHPPSSEPVDPLYSMSPRAFPHNQALQESGCLEYPFLLPVSTRPREDAYAIRTMSDGAGTKPKEDAFNVVLKVAKAARAVVRDISVESRSKFRYCHLVVPIVVLRGPLVFCHLEADSDALNVSEVSRVVVGVGHPGTGAPYTPVHVVREGALMEVLADLKESLALLGKELGVD